ncbi:cytochrome c biogenesis protein ResB [Cellulomonas sp. C5510]|uniref:cytochrome c biogenesis protein ResB n=1 Tax=Cellulomonas sp. C5510 TaxID=2871170 RepID=UPI002102F012|nr:cytochrome c biogenesis protein ResB [Cellulomonas sp. C5510]
MPPRGDLTRDRPGGEPASRYAPEGLDDSFTTGTLTPVEEGAEATTRLPSLGALGWLRWAWRQLTSMRVALLLLMLLATAAAPGTIFPQRAQAPEAVATFLTDNPTVGELLDRLGFFDVYASVWFSAIYLLLFVSLVGCILPRSRAHLRAMRARPPRVPRRFDRFPAQAVLEVDGSPQAVARQAGAALTGTRWRRRFRVDVREEGDGIWSVAAERGYLRETGNLVFHLALVGLLVSIAVGQFLHYRGQAIIVEGRAFANTQADYDTFESGAGYQASSLVPFSLRLDAFEARFDPATALSRDFTAYVTVTTPSGEPTERIIKVNDPLTIDRAKVYLQGNGYAPQVSVRDRAGEVVFAGTVPFLPQDTVYTSRGVIKVPDVTTGPQIGLQGALLPTAEEVSEQVWRSVYPQPVDPLLVLAVWTGDLGLDDGIPQNVYQLDTSGLDQVLDDEGQPVTLYLRPGESVDLPDGLGTLTFEALPRFVALDLRHDPSLTWVLVSSLLAFAGLSTSLFVPRRRVWPRLAPAGETRGHERTVVTGAALARGDDVGLQEELDRAMDLVRPAGAGQRPGQQERTGHAPR